MKTRFISFALIAFTQTALAVDLPTSGSQMQQLPTIPAQEKKEPSFRIDQKVAPVVPVTDQSRILVNTVRITGQTQFSEARLLEISGFRPGSRLSLSDLRAMALAISDHYHKHGYFVAQAYLPQQEIKDGVVVISVIEGRYGTITLKNQSNVSETTANGILSGLNSGDLIAVAPLERRLLLLSDLPGIEVTSTLIPGEAPGTSDLVVTISQGRRITGELDVDNAGNRYTGTYRVGATVNFNEPLGYGDIVSVRAMIAAFGLFYVRASYELQVGDGRVGVAYSILGYRLGEEFEMLHANGTAHVASIYGRYPLIRSRNTNLYAGLAFNAKTFQDRVDVTATVTDKQAHLFLSSLYGDHKDTLFGGGMSSASLTLTTGHLDIQTAAARSLDAATARSNGLYGKLGFSAMRLQRVTDSISLFGSINGQFAFNNLDVSEKMQLGGMYAVRAYPEGEAFADQGFVATLEARYLLPKFIERVPGQMHLVGFVDAGSVTINKNPWTAGSNSRTLSGAGIGLTWMEYNNFSLRSYYAFKLGNEAATSAPDESGRFWIQLVKYF